MCRESDLLATTTTRHMTQQQESVHYYKLKVQVKRAFKMNVF